MASKSTSASTASSTVTSRLPRSSIHTPLKPASVQDLKAKFDPGKAGDGSSSSSAESTVAGVQKSSRTKTVTSVSEPKGALAISVENDSTLLLSGRSSTGNMLSSVSSSLHAAAQRKLASNSTTSSSLSSSTLPSSALRSTSKSSAALTTARPFSPSSLSSSKSGSASSSGRSSPSTENSSKVVTTTATLSLAANKWEQNSAARAAKNNHTSRVSSILLSPSELRNNPDKIRDSTDLPMMHISVSGSEVTVEVKPRNSCAVKSEVAGETRPRSLVTSNKLPEGSEKKTDIGSSYLGKKFSDQKTTFNSKLSSVDKNRTSTTELSVSKQNSPPVQRSSKLIAKEIKIERLDSGVNVTTYKTNDSSKKSNATSAIKTASSSVGADNKSREISMGKTTSDKSSTSVSSANVDNTKLKATNTSSKPTDKTSGSNTGVRSHNKEVNTETGIKHRSAGTAKSDDPKPEFAQVKLRKTKTDPPKDASKLTSEKLDVKMDSDDVDDKRISRKISSERFERLMFDFQRGVPTETIVRRGSETDHIALQQKARELSKPQSEIDVPVIAKKKKEPSIFTEGLKVSDFVKQVNKMNPDAEGQPKWKAQRVRSQISSTASSDAGGDNFYQGIPGEDIENISDGDDDIYEKVTHRGESLLPACLLLLFYFIDYMRVM